MIGDIPRMGYGTWTHTGEEARRCVEMALEAGYRHIDTAQGYENEREVGRAIKASGIARNEVFITTKVRPENYGSGRFLGSVRESCDRLSVEQVDLLLLHWPSRQVRLEDYVAELAEAYDTGLAARIGVSNFNVALIDRAVALLGEVRLATNQVEAHVYLQNRTIVAHCQARGIPITAYCPMARGRIVGDPVLKAIGAAHGASEGQVALAFLLARGMIVIPTSRRREHIAANFAAQDIALSADEVARIEGLERGLRLVSSSAADWDA